MVLCCVACGTAGRSDGDTRDGHVRDADLDVMDGSTEADDLDADLFGSDAAEVMAEQEGIGPQDSEVDGGDAWEGKPSPRLLLCREGFADCLDIESVKAPYLRHGGWLRIESGTPALVPVQMAIALDQVPVPCASNVCDVTLETGDHGDGVTIDVVVRYGDSFSRNEWRSWTVPIFDCDVASGTPVCVAFGAWEMQEPVLEANGDVLVQGWDVAQRSDGQFVAALMVGPTVSGDESRMLFATGGAGAWSRSVVSTWSDGETTGLLKSGGVDVEFVGDTLRMAYYTMLGVEGVGGLHVDQQLGQNPFESLLFIPGWYRVEGANVQCGFETAGLPELMADLGLADDGEGSPMITFRTPVVYYAIDKANGDWRCEPVSGSDPDGHPRAIGGPGGTVSASARVFSANGLVHAVMGNELGAFYDTYKAGTWSDSLFVDHDPSGPIYYALNAISGAPGGDIDHAYFVGGDQLDGVDFGVRRIREGKVVTSTADALVSALRDVMLSSGRTPDEWITPVGLEVRDDSCGRPHVLLVEHAHLHEPSNIYSFSTLSGAWRGEWLGEIQPDLQDESGNVPNHDPYFFDNQGRQHLFYPLRPKGNNPEGTPSRLMHWMRPCEVYLTE